MESTNAERLFAAQASMGPTEFLLSLILATGPSTQISTQFCDGLLRELFHHPVPGRDGGDGCEALYRAALNCARTAGL